MFSIMFFVVHMAAATAEWGYAPPVVVPSYSEQEELGMLEYDAVMAEVDDDLRYYQENPDVPLPDPCACTPVWDTRCICYV